MKRPLFLTIWLALMTLGNVFSVYSYTLGSASLALALPFLPSWVMLLFALMSVVGLVAVVMLWMWKKMGFYLVVVLSVVVSAVNLLYLGLAGIFAVVTGFIGVGILYLAMKPVWQNFK